MIRIRIRIRTKMTRQRNTATKHGYLGTVPPYYLPYLVIPTYGS